MPSGRSRRVTRSADFIARAKNVFPPGGSAGGRPSFELFEQRILVPLERLASDDFEAWSGATADDPIRFFVTGAAGPFAPMVVFAALVGDSSTVELLDLEVDTGYWDLLGSDPEY